MDKILLGAVVFQLILTFYLMFLMGFSRIAAIKNHQVKMKDIALGDDKYPSKVKQIANAFNNQFQMPIIFYFGVVLSLFFGQVGLFEIILAYAFVVSRYIHAFIHITNNNLVWRLNAYFVGCLILMVFLVLVFFKGLF